MANGRSNSTTLRGMSTSGISKLPQILKYPTLFSLESALPYLKQHLCYIIRHYGNTGLAVLAVRSPQKDDVAVMFGSWDGEKYDLRLQDARSIQALEFSASKLTMLIKTMNVIKLQQAQFFFAWDEEGPLLADIQMSLNKFAGPGMIRDVFSKVFRTPEVIKIEVLDERSIEHIEKGTGSYAGDLIIKPSKFSMFVHGTQTVPLYAEIKR